jgi:hypothetical protein
MSRSKLSIDREAAAQVMRRAIKIAQNDSGQCPPTAWDTEIEMIVTGKHLTFRYLLVTAILAKATNPKINALALQAGAKIAGAYDARSLCHGVVVPLERQLLQRALGGSNEPFLNKPARFPTISPANAARAGKDREMLRILHHLLSEIETSEQAFSALCAALGFAIKQQNERARSPIPSADSQESHLQVLEFAEMFVSKSLGGQVAAILMGTFLSLYFEQFEFFEVIVHPVNQSGASSKEVADIDIKKNGEIFLVFEMKDKQFTDQDLDHAAFKASQYGLKSISFITGTSGVYVGESLEQAEENILAERGVSIVLVDLLSFVRSIVALCPDLSFVEFLQRLQNCAMSARVKDEVLEHIKESLK